MFNSAFEYIGVTLRGHIAGMQKNMETTVISQCFLRAVEFSVFWGA